MLSYILNSVNSLNIDLDAISIWELQVEQLGTVVDPYCFWIMELDLGSNYTIRKKEY